MRLLLLILFLNSRLMLFIEPSLFAQVYKASLVTQMVKNLPAMQEMRVQSLGWEDPLEKGMDPTMDPAFLPGEFHRQRAWQATVQRVTKSSKDWAANTFTSCVLKTVQSRQRNAWTVVTPLSKEYLLQDPEWISETADSIKPYIHCVFSHTKW